MKRVDKLHERQNCGLRLRAYARARARQPARRFRFTSCRWPLLTSGLVTGRVRELGGNGLRAGCRVYARPDRGLKL